MFIYIIVQVLHTYTHTHPYIYIYIYKIISIGICLVLQINDFICINWEYILKKVMFQLHMKWYKKNSTALLQILKHDLQIIYHLSIQSIVISFFHFKLSRMTLPNSICIICTYSMSPIINAKKKL
jgi:hypothetical protein